MDPQTRNLKDFLQLYNRLTELCFSQCIDNFFSRQVSENENSCVDSCLQKFTRVNQRIMSVYVEVQSDINNKRLTELENVRIEQEKAELAKSITVVPEILVPTESPISPNQSKVESAR